MPLRTIRTRVDDATFEALESMIRPGMTLAATVRQILSAAAHDATVASCLCTTEEHAICWETSPNPGCPCCAATQRRIAEARVEAAGLPRPKAMVSGAAWRYCERWLVNKGLTPPKGMTSKTEVIEWAKAHGMQ